MLSLGLAGYAAGDNKVTLDVSNVTLESVLRAIEKQTDYRFFYSKEAVDVKARVNVKAQNESVTALLDRILPKQGISYVINDQRIALKQASASQAANPAAKKTGSKGNIIKVSGQVTDKTGEPLIGASVKVGGQTTGIATDVDGRYEITMPEGGVLEFSYIGFMTEKKKVAKAGTLDVVLAEDSKLLDEVVVIGYGTIDKKELTSAVSHVSAKDFLSVAATDVSMLIQGKVPGLSVVNTAAADPNSAASLQIRGVSSREAGVSPLIVLDGVPGASLT
ncbi:MAG: carboxypeptidase-like regulatory domain-containing protein, partial [Muribaculaceae bacterium]|nr:carboxypeptidase-like regulatory domain-containing protein [Muribaculaceae bacterium]